MMVVQSDMVPLIYSPQVVARPLGPVGRLLAVAVSLTCLAGLGTAALLKPNPTGLGTHTALGMAPCGFQQWTGIPCPTCGMTTSWAWFARGNLAASLWVQPMGTVLAVMAVFGFWSGLYIAFTARPAHLLLSYVPSGYIVRWLATFAILAWIWKIYIQLHHLDGWR
jgi:hypothetical protein